MDQRLQDRIACITGAASGLGRATALKFANAGARVVCADLKPGTRPIDVEIREKYGDDRATFVECNVANEEEIKNLISKTVSWGGRLDIMCNYAGISTETSRGNRERLHETLTEDFDRTMSINTRGVWICCKYALSQMLQQEPRPANARGERTRGWIVNAASMFGLVGARHATSYVSSKHAVVGMTKQIAIDYAADKIHCNCLCPGFVQTPFISALTTKAEDVERIAAMHPWNAIGRAEDIADAALFLCSDEAAWVSGHAMVVDGAYTCQ